MVDHEDQLGLLIVTLVTVMLIIAVRQYLKYKKKLFKLAVAERHRLEAQRERSSEDTIWSITGQVPSYGEYGVNSDSLTIVNEVSKPPAYDDDPPSYEQALQLAKVASLAESSRTTETKSP